MPWFFPLLMVKKYLNPCADGRGICSVRQIAPVHESGFAVRALSVSASTHKYLGRQLIL